ncbi:MAG: DUF2272 domain-containing protein [Pseudomonadota bacterium]
MPRRLVAAALLIVALGCDARTDEVAPSPPGAPPSALASRIAAIALAEHALWHRPFIDENGRLASMTVAEAEGARLADGRTEAWRRVAAYWRESGLLWRMRAMPGAAECAYSPDDAAAIALCRTFLIDHPWSAAFVSWVMTKAGVPGFVASPSHVEFVAHAYRAPGGRPYRLTDPALEAPAAGDLLCFVRSAGEPLGHAGLRAFLDAHGAAALPMHCEIVAAVGQGRAHLVGGNVLQGVTLRVLHVNRLGRLWGLPQRTGLDPGCAPERPQACSFNRQDWAALLKLDPSLQAAAPPPFPSPPAR